MRLPAILLSSLVVLGLNASLLRADEVPAEYRAAIKKGLEWMAHNQAKDGHWEAFGGQYPVTMTAVGGMSMLMKGARSGKGSTRTTSVVRPTG